MITDWIGLHSFEPHADVKYLLSMPASSSTLKAGIWHLHVAPMLEINKSSVQTPLKNESLLGFYGDGRYIVTLEQQQQQQFIVPN